MSVNKQARVAWLYNGGAIKHVKTTFISTQFTIYLHIYYKSSYFKLDTKDLFLPLLIAAIPTQTTDFLWFLLMLVDNIMHMLRFISLVH